MRWFAIVCLLVLAAVLGPHALADKPPAPGRAGQACSLNKTCKTGLICGPQNTCIAPTRIGAACAANTCESGAGCVGGVCIALTRIGQACTANTCEAGAACSNGVCASGGGVGQACLPGDVCQRELVCSPQKLCLTL